MMMAAVVEWSGLLGHESRRPPGLSRARGGARASGQPGRTRAHPLCKWRGPHWLVTAGCPASPASPARNCTAAAVCCAVLCRDVRRRLFSVFPTPTRAHTSIATGRRVRLCIHTSPTRKSGCMTLHRPVCPWLLSRTFQSRRQSGATSVDL